MIDSSVSTPNPTPFVSLFLDFIDRSSELLKLNVPQIIEIEKLRQLPSGTFGRTLADFFLQNNLQPFTTGPRRKQLHDAVHVLTGYGTDPVGEAEVQAFLIGCKFRLAHVVIGLGLLRIIQKQLSEVPTLILRIQCRLPVSLAIATLGIPRGYSGLNPMMVLHSISGLATFIQSVPEPRQPPASRRQKLFDLGTFAWKLRYSSPVPAWCLAFLTPLRRVRPPRLLSSPN